MQMDIQERKKTNNMYKRTINDITTVDGMKFDNLNI
jgi:hypothetical protein